MRPEAIHHTNAFRMKNILPGCGSQVHRITLSHIFQKLTEHCKKLYARTDELLWAIPFALISSIMPWAIVLTNEDYGDLMRDNTHPLSHVAATPSAVARMHHRRLCLRCLRPGLLRSRRLDRSTHKMTNLWSERIFERRLWPPLRETAPSSWNIPAREGFWRREKLMPFT